MSKLKPATTYFDQAKLISQKGILVKSLSSCEDFLAPLKKIFKKYSGSIQREHIGFPYRWKSMLAIKVAPVQLS